MAQKGTYVELDPSNIDEGYFQAKFKDMLQALYKDLLQYHADTESTKGKAKLTVKLELQQSDEKHLQITYGFTRSVPTAARQALVRGAGGKLLINPEGDSLNDRDQMVMTFDKFGNPAAKVNPTTGEIIDDEDGHDSDVAGKVNTA